MRRRLRDTRRRGNAFVSRCSLLCLSIALIVSSARLVSGQRWPVAQDENLRRITVSNDDGDVYVESSGDGSEIVLKTEKVRVTDGDVYIGTSNVGLSAQIDALKTKDDALDERIDTLNDTQIGLRDDLDALETSTSGRLTSIDTTLTSLASADTSLLDTDASLSSRIDALNATDAQLKATDETLKTRVSALNATDTALKGVDDGLSSRIDALRDIYVNELNVTDKQLIVTDATLGSRIDDLNATQYELKGVDAGLSIRIDALESTHVEYERIDDQMASLIDALNATDAALLTADEAFTAADESLSNRIDALNATDAQLKATDDALKTHISTLNATDAELESLVDQITPPTCLPPGGDKLQFNGTRWICVCVSKFWHGNSCDIPPPWQWTQKIGPIPSSAWAIFDNTSILAHTAGEYLKFDLSEKDELSLQTSSYDLFPQGVTYTEWDSTIMQDGYFAVGSATKTYWESGANRRKGIASVFKQQDDGSLDAQLTVIGCCSYSSHFNYGQAVAIGVRGSYRTFVTTKQIESTCLSRGCSGDEVSLQIYVNSGSSRTWNHVQEIVMDDWRNHYILHTYFSIKMSDFSSASDGKYWMAVHAQRLGKPSLILYQNDSPGTLQSLWTNVHVWTYSGYNVASLTIKFSFSDSDLLIIGVGPGMREDRMYNDSPGFSVSTCTQIKVYHLTDFSEIQTVKLPTCVLSFSLQANEKYLVVSHVTGRVVYVYERQNATFMQIDEIVNNEYDDYTSHETTGFGSKVALNKEGDIFVASAESLANASTGVVMRYRRLISKWNLDHQDSSQSHQLSETTQRGKPSSSDVWYRSPSYSGSTRPSETAAKERVSSFSAKCAASTWVSDYTQCGEGAWREVGMAYSKTSGSIGLGWETVNGQPCLEEDEPDRTFNTGFCNHWHCWVDACGPSGDSFYGTNNNWITISGWYALASGSYTMSLSFDDSCDVYLESSTSSWTKIFAHGSDASSVVFSVSNGGEYRFVFVLGNGEYSAVVAITSFESSVDGTYW